jgi:Response regulator containing a CheY-like receiver domain and an HTH DNA-binding domain
MDPGRSDSGMIDVLIVDDQQIVREGLRSVLRTDPGVTIVGEYSDGAQAIEALNRLRPDVVVMDVRMPVMDGALATQRIRELQGPPVLILTTFDDDETLARALRAGTAGFLLKSAPGEDILRAIHAVSVGGSWIDPAVAARVLQAYRTSTYRGSVDVSMLTDRELDVLRSVGRGLTNQEVAQELFIGEATVKTHLAHALAKLDLRDRSAAIVFVHENGLASDECP